MFSNLNTKYPHMRFAKQWELNKKTWFLLGEAEAYTRAISYAAIHPKTYADFVRYSYAKGAHSSALIEGNILTEDEALKIDQTNAVLLSKKYHFDEVKNMINIYKNLSQEIVEKNEVKNIDTIFIKYLHAEAGKNLGEGFGAVPGEFRNDNITASKFRCADHEDVPELISKMCDWIPKEFNYGKGQVYADVILQALVTHVYFLWIRPFADGNGPAARLVEFYTLLRGGNPILASHILSNHYYLSKTEYFRQLENAALKRDLTDFIEYGLTGLCKGLSETLTQLLESQRQTIWGKLVYDYFAENNAGHQAVASRMRKLAMSMTIEKNYRVSELKSINSKIAAEYAKVSPLTLERDLAKLVSFGLLIKDDAFYRTNTISNIAKMYLKA